MFSLSDERLDQAVDDWVQRRGARGTRGELDDARPGFTVPQLLATLDVPGERHMTKTTRELFKFVYWLFAAEEIVSRAGPSPAKAVLLADTVRTPPNGGGRAHLAVHAADGPAVLIPVPMMPSQLLLGAPYERVGESRAALQRACLQLVARANLAWPTAVALAAAAQAELAG